MTNVRLPTEVEMLQLSERIKVVDLELVSAKLAVDMEISEIMEHYYLGETPRPVSFIKETYLGIGSPHNDYKLRELREKFARAESNKKHLHRMWQLNLELHPTWRTAQANERNRIIS